MPSRRNGGGGDGGDPPVPRPSSNDTAAAAAAAAPPSYMYSRPAAVHQSQHKQYLHSHTYLPSSQPRGQPYAPPYAEGRSDTTGPRLLYNGQSNHKRDTSTSNAAMINARVQHNGRVGGNGGPPMNFSPPSGGRPSAVAAGPPMHKCTSMPSTRSSAPSPSSMLPGDTPFGIRMPRAIPSTNAAGTCSGARGPSSQPHGDIGSSNNGRGLSQPPSNRNTPPNFAYGQCNTAASVQARLTSSPADNSMGVETIHQVGVGRGGALPASMGPGSPPRSPTEQAVFLMPGSPSRSPSAISSSPGSPNVSPRALPAVVVSTRGSSLNSQGSPPSSPGVTGKSPSSSYYTRPSFEGTTTTGCASSYGNENASDTYHQPVTTMDDSRTYETGTVDSGTYQSSTVAMTRSHSYTATLGDEETATYLSGTIASQTVQTEQTGGTGGTGGTSGTGAYGQSFDSTYRTSRETYDTDDLDDGEETAGDDTEATEAENFRGQRSGGGKKKSRIGSRLNRWGRGRQGKEVRSTYDGGGDESTSFDYAAFRDNKRPSQSRGRFGSATSPRSSKEILSASPSGVSLRTADIDARVVRIEKMDYQNTQQQHGYLAILLTVVQTLILAAMMAFCGAAPLTINWSMGPYPDALSEFGAKNPYLMIEMNQWWRFFTSQMLTTGVIHLLCNAYVQLEAAAFYEREWGSRRWGIIYFCSAVGSTIVSSILDPDTIGVSSSGALMGIFGAKFAEVLTLTIFDTFYRRDGAAFRHLSGTFCSLVTVCLFCAAPLVDWSGHIGGLATGFFLGMVLFGKYIRKIHLKAAWQLLGLAIFIACLGTAINELVNHVTPSDATGDACTYYKSIFMNQEYDCQCQLGHIYATSSYNYGDDGYVDDALNGDDENGYDDDGDDGEDGAEDGNNEDDQQENDGDDEEDDNEREEENDRDGEEE